MPFSSKYARRSNTINIFLTSWNYSDFLLGIFINMYNHVQSSSSIHCLVVCPKDMCKWYLWKFALEVNDVFNSRLNFPNKLCLTIEKDCCWSQNPSWPRIEDFNISWPLLVRVVGVPTCSLGANWVNVIWVLSNSFKITVIEKGICLDRRLSIFCVMCKDLKGVINLRLWVLWRDGWIHMFLWWASDVVFTTYKNGLKTPKNYLKEKKSYCNINGLSKVVLNKD